MLRFNFRSAGLFGLMTLLFGGCVTGPRDRAPDWEDTANPVAPLPPVVPALPVQPSPAPEVPRSNTILAVEPAETWVPLRRWCQANALPAPACIAATPTPVYAVHGGRGTFVLRIGSQIAHWDGLEVHLGFAPQLIDTQPYVHALDLRKTIHPLLDDAPKPCLRVHPVIVLDPGHGGTDAGTRSVVSGRYEKELTLDWARRVQALLATNGWQVLLTRSNDADLPLSNRVAFAEEHKADLFLSLHFNAAGPGESEAGLETYCLTPAGLPSNLTRSFADDPSAIFPNNAFDAQNLLLALRVHRALLQVNGHHDRGVRRARFPGVLRGQQRPAILVEGGFLSNAREARLIGDPAYRQRLAESLAGALIGLEPGT
jgi:N-acetylmuramoyl-L-alanine amidase